ncbi:MAG: hypothetical protein ABEJ42_10410 [Halobacteriaceae archaeon]
MAERAQAVLLAAAVVAVALVPILVAYAQLGYHGDVDAATRRADADVVGPVQRTLDAAVGDAAVATEFTWMNRTAAAEAVRRRLEPTLAALRASRVEGALAVSYAPAVASEVPCPRGPNRQFGPCLTDGAVVLQERRGTTHLVGVGLRVRVLDGRRSVWVAVFARPRGHPGVANASVTR